jgi:hypothetical protein
MAKTSISKFEPRYQSALISKRASILKFKSIYQYRGFAIRYRSFWFWSGSCRAADRYCTGRLQFSIGATGHRLQCKYFIAAQFHVQHCSSSSITGSWLIRKQPRRPGPSLRRISGCTGSAAAATAKLCQQVQRSRGAGAGEASKL